MEVMTDHKWLTTEHFKKLISTIHTSDSSIDIHSIKVDPATKPGDNHCSNMYRVRVEYRVNEVTKIKSFIVKSIPTNETARKLVTENKMFDIEIDAYNNFVNTIDSMLSNTSDPIKIAPVYYGIVPGGEQSLCLEDLRESGFSMYPPRKQFDLKSTKMILTKLAKFHACSVLIDEKHPEYKNGFFLGTIAEAPQRDVFNNFVRQSIRSIGDLMESRNSKYRDLNQLLHKISDKIIGDCERTSYTYDPNIFNVLNHNDLWANNFMFKFNDNKDIDDVVFVDFQFAYWGSPAIDLNYFLYSSVQLEVMKKYRNSLINHYHSELVATLQSLSYSKWIITLEELHHELIRTAPKGIIPAFCIASMLLSSEEVDFSILVEDSARGQEYRNKLYTNPTYYEFIEGIIEILLEQGYFNYST